MKLVKHTHENTRAGISTTVMAEFETFSEGYEKVASLEDNDFYPQDNGFVLDANGNEVFDPAYNDYFDFTDYHYSIKQ